MKGFVVYPTYQINDHSAQVLLFGRLENGKSFLVRKSFKPYFFIRKADLEKAKSLASFSFEDPHLKAMTGEDVVRIIMKTPKEVPEIRKVFADESIPSYEADIRFAYRFMMDHGIKGGLEIIGDGKTPEKQGPEEQSQKGNAGNADLPSENVDLIFDEPELKPCSFMPKLRILSFDIETDMKAKKIFSISFYSSDHRLREVLMVSKEKPNLISHTVQIISYPDEKRLLEAFRKKVIDYDPDIITGWNLIDFDLNVMKRKFEEHGIRFSFGRIGWDNRLRLTNDFFRTSKADVPGRIVLDGIAMLKDAFIKLTDYKLGTAAKEILGDKKLIEGENRFREIERLYDEDKKALAEYNYHDSKLVMKILNKTGVIELAILRSLMTGMQLDRVSASIASLDSVYLPRLKEKGYVAPTSVYTEKNERIKGGYVRESKPGIYDYVIVLDFKSLYPSVMRTFNIDPLSFVRKKPDNPDPKDYIKAPNGAYFRNDDGILPKILEELWKKRDEAKKNKNKIASHAIKILMNSFFGVLASPNCRFFSMDMANAITHFGQYVIKLTAENIEKKGYDVIYGDTDSIFVNLDVKNAKQSQIIGKAIQDEMNMFFEEFVTKKYYRENFLELEFEKVYKKFLMPYQRHAEKGSKKRYAGLKIISCDDGDEKTEMDFVGLEFVRRDWTDLAKKFQLELLEKIFNGDPVDKYIKDFLADLRKGKYDSLLVYKKAIRKNLEEYVKTTPPHVKAARKLQKLTTNIIEYVMTLDGPEPIQLQKSPLDYEHYIEKQIKPIADSVLIFFNKRFDDLSKKTRQHTLEGF